MFRVELYGNGTDGTVCRHVVKATFAALLSLKDANQVAETRSKTLEEISGRPPKAEKVEKAAGE